MAFRNLELNGSNTKLDHKTFRSDLKKKELQN